MSEHKTHAEIIAEQLTNIESFGDELPAVIAAGSLRKLLRHLDEAHKREIEDAERRGNHEATAAICETIEKVGPLYDAESVGNSAKLRKAVEETKSTIARCMEILNKIPDSCGYGGLLDDVADELCDLREECIKDALAAPARNCDFGTAEEQDVRFGEFCLKHIGCAEETGGKHCLGCPLEKATENITQRCELYWAQLPYEAE